MRDSAFAAGSPDRRYGDGVVVVEVELPVVVVELCPDGVVVVGVVEVGVAVEVDVCDDPEGGGGEFCAGGGAPG